MDEEVKLKNNYHTIVETSFYNFLWYPKEFPVTTQPGALIQGYTCYGMCTKHTAVYRCGIRAAETTTKVQASTEASL